MQLRADLSAVACEFKCRSVRILSRRTPCLERSKSDGAEARGMPVDYPAVPNKSGGAEARCPVQHSISGHKLLEKKANYGLFCKTRRSRGMALWVILREFLSVLRFPQSAQSTEFGKEYVTMHTCIDIKGPKKSFVRCLGFLLVTASFTHTSDTCALIRTIFYPYWSILADICRYRYRAQNAIFICPNHFMFAFKFLSTLDFTDCLWS